VMADTFDGRRQIHIEQGHDSTSLIVPIDE
jgi:hypothetical protein